MDLAGLGEALDRKVKGCSTGMKQRLMLARALMREPDVLILDELGQRTGPRRGPGPARVPGEPARRGGAVLVSSHQLAEVRQPTTHVVVMNHGRLIAAGPMDELLGAAAAPTASGWTTPRRGPPCCAHCPASRRPRHSGTRPSSPPPVCPPATWYARRSRRASAPPPCSRRAGPWKKPS
ncbi:ATP-binding cassette domain-containing protein [Streptomyces lasalocidi]